MAHFSYRIRTTEGKTVRGMLEAPGQKEAIEKARRLGDSVLDLHEVQPQKGFKFHLAPRLSLKERIIFTEQLAVMLKAGITLVQALKGLQEESQSKGLARILETMVVDVEGGLPFSQALAKHPAIFSRIYSQMIGSAEKTGNMAEVLSKLTIQQQKEYELKGKVKGALMYPAIISVLLVGVIILVLTFILPKLTGLFTDSGVALPWSTKLLIAISNVFANQWYLILGGVIALVVGFRFMVRTKKGLWMWDSFKIRLPVLGSFMRKSYIARFTQSFASLAQAGVPVLDIFNTLQGIVGNSVYEAEIKKIASDVENGIKVSTAIRKSKYFPSMVGQLVSVGEQSGDMAEVFVVLGDFFEKEVDGMAKNLSTILEPIIMVVMGAGVGFVLISVLQPIFNLTNAV